MKFFFYLSLILAFCSPSINKQEESTQEKVKTQNWIVTPASGLNLRESPSLKSKSIRLLPFGTLIHYKLIPENEKEAIIDEQKGKWLKVDFENDTGWVFDVYLSEPIFSPSKDKFYFYRFTENSKTIHTKNRQISFCKSDYHVGSGFDWSCEVFMVLGKDQKPTKFKNMNEMLQGWIDNEHVLELNSGGEGGAEHAQFKSYNVNRHNRKLLYYTMRENIIFMNQNQVIYNNYIQCYYSSCYRFQILKDEKIMKISKIKSREEYFSFPKDPQNEILLKSISFKNFVGINITDLKDEKVFQLKENMGTIHFSVELKNYALDVPTGKIIEVKAN